MKPVIISFLITDDQKKELRRQHRAYEDKHDESISVSEYIRRTLFPPASNPFIPLEPTSEQESEPLNKFSFDKLT